jgi:hypothetical protein
MSEPLLVAAPEPEILTLSADGSLLAAAAPAYGSTEVHLISLAERALVRTLDAKAELRSIALSAKAELCFVGAKTIVAFAVATGKKAKVAYKGHKAPPRALLADGDALFSAGGSRIYDDDCAVRRFDVASGALTWTSKGKKGKGYGSLARLGAALLATCDDGSVWGFDAASGRPLGVAAVGEGASFGGVAGDGHTAVVTWVRDAKFHVGFVAQRAQGLTVEGVTEVPLAGIDAAEGVHACVPAAAGGAQVAFVAAKCWVEEQVHLACTVDLSSRRVSAPFRLPDTGNVQGLRAAVGPDGTIAWPTEKGVAVGREPGRVQTS